jgi:ATP-dependent Clp protease ATP-binding subunit ClpB
VPEQFQGTISSRLGQRGDRKMPQTTKKRLDPRKTGQAAEQLNVDLHRRIVGQNDAIDQIVSIYQTFLAGLATPGRPIGNFLFLGPTGSGKTRLVEATAESLLGDMNSVIKIDCGEFQHSHEIAKLIGSPPGYLGHRETHPLLSQEVLNQHHTDTLKVSFVLFDEIEKASDALWNLLLGILDKATLTLGDNRRVDFSRAMIFMTSNLGASEMGTILRPKLGFGNRDAERRCLEGMIEDGDIDKISRSAIEAARRKFTPEFMNRIDKVVVFQPLGSAELDRILTLELDVLQQRIFNSAASTPFVFNLTQPAREFLLTEGTDMKYGARHLKRAIDRELVHPLSNLVASKQIRPGDLVSIDFDQDNRVLDFSREAEDRPTHTVSQMTENRAAIEAAQAASTAYVSARVGANAKTSKR